MIDTKHNDRHKVVTFTVPDSVGKVRLDKLIGKDPAVNVTRSLIQKLIEAGLVTVDDRPAEHNHTVHGGEKVIISIPPVPKMELIPEAIPLNIAYEDEHLLVVDKPAGMVTHPAAGNYTGTLVHALLHHARKLSKLSGFERPGIVHRLDKNTSGLIIVAKNDRVHLALQDQLRERQIRRSYLALVCGHVKEETGAIDLPIGRSFKDRKKMTVTARSGRAALTKYKLVDRFRAHDLLEIYLQTGRTHQIRVHFSHLGHPVFGDPDYGGRNKWHRGIFSIDRQMAKQALDLIDRQALHAARLAFTHPVTRKQLELESALPDDFRVLLQFLDQAGR
ncbi:MAG: RluA family pseudouridine synthase [Candidatus Zixiibacteriota bacterium]|nr:MAG: RluA family pseudouridine synthase [candidate division Zixibacteria bacterium]